MKSEWQIVPENELTQRKGSYRFMGEELLKMPSRSFVLYVGTRYDAFTKG